MSAARYLVGTNILLRFLSGEPTKQAATGEAVLEVSPATFAEAYHTLISFYSVDRK